MAEHNDLGKKGEDIAVAYLQRKGYKILCRNWHDRHLEIDIVAMHNNMLVVVEVKTRTTALFGEPEMEVTPAKQKFLVRAAESYILAHDYEGETRFDVIGVLLGNGQMQIKHIEDAFMPL